MRTLRKLLKFAGNTFIWSLLYVTAPAQVGDKIVDSVEIMSLESPLHSMSQLGGVCVDRLGYIYVANFRDVVWKISPKGRVKLLTDGLYGSSGNCIDSKGDLYQANFFANSIIKIDRFGEVNTYVENGLNGPVGLVKDAEGNLYICNFKGNNILKVNPEKQISVFAASDLFNGPNGITSDNSGNLYVANFNSNVIVRIDGDGQSETFANTGGVDGNAHICFLNEKFYVTKIKSNQIFVINSAGVCRLFAGVSSNHSISGGPAHSATFLAPNGIAADAISGALYVNNLNGQWTSKQPSTIDLARIKLSTLPQILTALIDQNEHDLATKAFWSHHRDTFNLNEDLVPSIASLGWQYMVKRNVSACILLFDLINQAYPNRWQPNYHLGEAYKIIGQFDKAQTYYEAALALDPSNTQIQNRLSELK